MWVDYNPIVFGAPKTVRNRAKVNVPPAWGGFMGLGGSRFMVHAYWHGRDSAPLSGS